jgi:Zn-dependent peptidase ImmA (M78 family)
MKASPLPKKIKFPFDFVIEVKVIPEEQLESLMGRGCEGAYLPDARMIVVSRSLTTRKRRYIVAHEMTHALNEYFDEGLRSGIMEVPE